MAFCYQTELKYLSTVVQWGYIHFEQYSVDITKWCGRHISISLFKCQNFCRLIVTVKPMHAIQCMWDVFKELIMKSLPMSFRENDNFLLFIILDPVCRSGSYFVVLIFLQECIHYYQNRWSCLSLKRIPSLCFYKSASEKKNVTLQWALKFSAPTERIKTQ